MNKIKTTVKSISQVGSLHRLELLFDGEKLYVYTLELPENLRLEADVVIGIKATSIALSNDFQMRSSFDNQLKASIVGVEEGELLTSVKCALGGVIVEAIISSKAYNRMELQTGDSVVILLNGNEISLVG